MDIIRGLINTSFYIFFRDVENNYYHLRGENLIFQKLEDNFESILPFEYSNFSFSSGDVHLNHVLRSINNLSTKNLYAGASYQIENLNINRSDNSNNDGYYFFLPPRAYNSHGETVDTLPVLLQYLNDPSLFENQNVHTSKNNLWTQFDEIGYWYDYCDEYSSCSACFSTPNFGGVGCYINPYQIYDENGKLGYPTFIIGGPKGEKGEIGEQGIQGIRGLRGEKGEPGALGEIGSAGNSFSWTSSGSLAIITILTILTLVMIFLLATQFHPNNMKQLFVPSVGIGLIVSVLLLFLIMAIVS